MNMCIEGVPKNKKCVISTKSTTTLKEAFSGLHGTDELERLDFVMKRLGYYVPIKLVWSSAISSVYHCLQLSQLSLPP